MLYVWLGVGLLVVVLLTRFFKAYNSGKIAESEAKQAAEQTERLQIRKDAQKEKRDSKASRRANRKK